MNRIHRSAAFSDCRTWRYTLERYWRTELPRICFVLLNPSTADEKNDDPTNRRAIDFAMRWGYGACVFVNLFAFRTPSPEVMKQALDPVGPDNDFWIQLQARLADTVVFAWGVHGTLRGRDQEVMALLAGRQCHTMGITKDGHPKHPLYLAKDTLLVPWEPREKGPVGCRER